MPAPREITELVDDLHGLTGEEIKIVEGKSKNPAGADAAHF
jgi:hypothetical protein